MNTAFSSLSRETAREVSCVSARLQYLVDEVRTKEDVAVKEGSALFCAVAALSERSRWKRSVGVSSHI